MPIIQGVAVDITASFKASISLVKARNKNIQEPNGKSKIFPIQIGPFFKDANDILKNISAHYVLLLEHKKNYLKDENATFSEEDKLYLEKVIVTNLNAIDTNIKKLELEMKITTMDSISSQASECRHNSLHIIKRNYMVISTLFKNMKDSRLKRQKEKNMLLSLHRPSNIKNNSKSVAPEKSPRAEPEDSEDTPIESVVEKEVTYTYIDREMDSILSELSVEETQMLEEENIHLHRELLSNRDEIKQITSQVVELSKMQDILTENVDLQGQQIEDIHDTVISSTDNVQRGNEEIREAMRKDAAFRVWIMFILIVMSLSILFLDWYNP